MSIAHFLWPMRPSPIIRIDIGHVNAGVTPAKRPNLILKGNRRQVRALLQAGNLFSRSPPRLAIGQVDQGLGNERIAPGDDEGLILEIDH